METVRQEFLKCTGRKPILQATVPLLSPRSAGKLHSIKLQLGHPRQSLTPAQLKDEFQRHIFRSSRRSTALVSTTKIPSSCDLQLRKAGGELDTVVTDYV